MNNSVIDIQTGIALQKSGDHESAINVYKRLIQINKDDCDAYHLLGMVKNSQGKHREALNYVNMAISLNRSSIFLNTRATIFIDLGLLDEAKNDLNAAIKLTPNYSEAFNNLAVINLKLRRYDKAVEFAKKSLCYNDMLPQAWVTLGGINFESGDFEQAKFNYQRALELDQKQVLARINLAKICYLQKSFDDALVRFNDLISRGINALDVAYPHAQILLSQGSIDEASNLLLNSYNSTKDFACLESLIKQDVFFNVLWKVCGYFAEVLGKPTEAFYIYNKTLEFVPEYAHLILVNIAKIYFDINRLEEAIEYCQKAIECKFSNPVARSMAYNNMGVFYLGKEDSYNAIKCFEKAIEIDSNHVLSLGWLLKEKAHICSWNGYKDIVNKLDKLRFTSNNQPISPFTPLAVYNDPLILKYWAELSAHEIFDKTATQVAPMVLPSHRRSGKIRIGYYSFDFRDHPVAHLTARVFELHDKDEFEVYAYSYGPDDGSHVRNRIISNSDHFIDVRDLSVLETAQRIAQDDIDFLIDLTGNTKGHRCQVLSLRPARYQAHWLGFIGTMGSRFYHFIIADEIVAPLNSQAGFTESILQIPGGFHVADDVRVIHPTNESRKSLGLPEDGVVFGCFAQTFKVQPDHFERWMEILRQVPDSVIWMASGPKGATDNLKFEMSKLGVDPERMVIAERCSRSEYLSRFQLMDVHLDTFPYTSGTVASDALYGGCPLVTLSGNTMVSRMAGSILVHAGYPNLVSYSSAEFVAKAVELGLSKEKRDGIRKSLLEKRDNENLLSVKNVVKGIEKAVKGVLRSE